MKEKELVLFSGGPDSTILLEYLLKQNKFIHVLYVQLAYHKNKKVDIQNQTVINILNYFKKEKGYSFDYTSSGIFLDIHEDLKTRWGSDDQWNAFFAALVCRTYNIKKTL